MADALYDDDFYAWTKAQADALRRRESGANALDWDHLAEEIEDLGKSDRRACESYIEQILGHFLKIAVVGPSDVAAHWRAEIIAFRIDLERRLTPSLRAQLPAELDDLFAIARRKLAAKLEAGGVEVELPATCPYDWDDVMGRGADWTPEPVADEPPR